MLHDEGPCFCPRALRSSMLLTHYGFFAKPSRQWTTYRDDGWLDEPDFYAKHIGDPAAPTQCFDRRKDLIVPPWKHAGFWRQAFDKKWADPHRKRRLLLFFAGDLGRKRQKGCAHDPRPARDASFGGSTPATPASRLPRDCTFWHAVLGVHRYSHDLRQRALGLFCDPSLTPRASCSPYAGGCRTDVPLNCSLWRPGVLVSEHSKHYHQDLLDSAYCLALPGDGWSSRVLDAVVLRLHVTCNA